MATIEQRASVHSEEHYVYNAEAEEAYYNGYIKGANDQQSLLLDKAFQWWWSRAESLGIGKYQVELFRIAMEEENGI